MLSTFLFAFQILSIGVLPADGQDITFAAPASPASALLPRLSKALGVDLLPSPQTKDEVLLIRAKHVSAKDLMDRIAQVTHAEWKTEGSSYRLIRSSATNSRIRRQDVEQRTAEIQTLLQSEAGTNPTSGRQRVLDLLAQIGPRALSEIEPDTRAVFSSHPSAMQNPFPDNAGFGTDVALLVVRTSSGLIDAKFVEQNLAGGSVDHGTLFSTRPNIPVPSGPIADPITLSALPAEFVRVWSGRRTDPNGAPHSSSSVMMTAAQPNIQFRSSSADSVQNQVRLSEPLRQWLVHPEDTDPEGLVPGDALTFAADSRQENLVADLPDSAFSALTERFSLGPVSVTDLLQVVGPGAGLEIRQSPGWMTVAPRNPAEAARRRVNRATLGKLLRSLDAKHFLTLGDMAAFCLEQVKPLSIRDVDGILLLTISPQAGLKAMTTLDNPYPLRIYGTLTDGQKQAIRAKQTIQIADLTADQKRWLEFDVFNSDPELEVRGIARPDWAIGIPVPGEFRAERTVVLPHGLPALGTLEVDVDESGAYLATDSSASMSAMVTANMLASERFQRERSDLAFLGSPPNFDHFEPAKQITYRFRYQITPDVASTRTLTGMALESNSQSVAFEYLPSAFRAEVDRQLQLMRQTFKSRVGGNKVTPP